MSEEKEETIPHPITLLLELYKASNNGDRSDLRHLESYQMVQEHGIFYKIRTALQSRMKEPQNPREIRDDVLAAILLFWRDRGANTDELLLSSQPLGSLMAVGFHTTGTPLPKVLKVKATRYKRILGSETLEEAFHELRKTLTLFRHDPVNWIEIADLLNALGWKNEEQIRWRKRQIAKAYFELVENISPNNNTDN